MKTLLPLWFLLSAVALQAAEGGVHGRVYGQTKSGENLGPVAGAQIVLKSDSGSSSASARTNASGYYQIPTLAAGAYRYSIRATGYREENEQRGFIVPPDTREFVHDFLLTADAQAPVSPAQAKTTLPAIHGRVYGQTETGENLGPLPGAKIQLLSGQGGTVVATATASSPGAAYEIKGIPAANYLYRVSAPGFLSDDAGRGFTVPPTSLEYVHDFILTRQPPKRDRCDLAILVVKRISIGQNPNEVVRLPVASAKLLFQSAKASSTPANQPFVTDAKGEFIGKDFAEGDYTVAIDAPECEPFIGTVKLTCDSGGQIILELQPCNELLHSYVRVMLHEGWGSSSQAKGNAERAFRQATKAKPKDGSVHYARALTHLSAGDQATAQQSLAEAIANKQEGTAWDRACEARLWMNLCQHQPTQAVREVRSLVQKHYADRAVTAASKDTAHICGITLGLLKGPWHEEVSASDTALLESDLLTTLKGELRVECQKAMDQVAAEFGKLQAAEEAARRTALTSATEQRNAEVTRLAERQKAISQDVSVLDADIQRLQAATAQADQQLRVQMAGFMQQRQLLAAQIQPLNARLQQLAARLAQVQMRGQTGTTMPNNPQTRMPQRETGVNPGFAEAQQIQAEMQQTRQRMAIIQQQDAVMAANLANLQNQFQRGMAGTAQADLNAKTQQRTTLAEEFERLDRQRMAPFDPAAVTTPEIKDIVRRKRSVKTYRDLPLEERREDLLILFQCGSAKEPQRPAQNGRPIEIFESDFPQKRPSGNLPSTSSLPPRSPARSDMPAPATTSTRPAPSLGDPAEIVVTNNHPTAVTLFALTNASPPEQLVRSLAPGSDAMVPAAVGQTFVIRASTTGQELQRHQVSKKLEVLKLGGAR